MKQKDQNLWGKKIIWGSYKKKMKKNDNFWNISLLWKTGKVYEAVTLMFEKFRKLSFESYINISKKEEK